MKTCAENIFVLVSCHISLTDGAVGEMVSGAVLVRGLSVRVCLCVSSDGDDHILECVSLYNNVVIYRPVENCSFIHNIA